MNAPIARVPAVSKDLRRALREEDWELVELIAPMVPTFLYVDGGLGALIDGLRRDGETFGPQFDDARRTLR